MVKGTRLASGILAAVFTALVLGACQGTPEQKLIDRGRDLAVGCQTCHSPKVFTEEGAIPDSTRAFSGHPQGLKTPEVDIAQVRSGWLFFNDHMTCWVGAWGISFARNLTPDVETGIGSWSEETFILAMRTGRHLGLKDARPIVQPMPWSYLASKSSDKDLRAIFAYLRSIKPIVNQVPSPIPLEELVKDLPK